MEQDYTLQKSESPIPETSLQYRLSKKNLNRLSLTELEEIKTKDTDLEAKIFYEAAF